MMLSEDGGLMGEDRGVGLTYREEAPRMPQRTLPRKGRENGVPTRDE